MQANMKSTNFQDESRNYTESGVPLWGSERLLRHVSTLSCRRAASDEMRGLCLQDGPL